MLSIDLRRGIAEFLAKSNDFQAMFELVGKIATFYDDSTQFILAQTEGGTALNNAANALQSRFGSLHAVTQTIVPRPAYKSLEAFTEALSASFDAAQLEHPFLREALDAIENFVALYDKFLMQQTAQNAAHLMLTASMLNRRLRTTLEALDFVQHSTAGPAEVDGTTELSLALYGNTSFAAFIQKLQDLQALYSELCMLLDVSEADHPLEIGKIESGSLWVWVFGEAKVMGLATKLIESSIGFIYRTQTTEGQLAAIPRKLESLEAAIQMSTKLRELGVNTSEMDDQLRKSGVVIAKHLTDLLEGQPKVRVNERVFAVNDRIEPYLLTEWNVPKLKHDTRPDLSPPASTPQLPHDPQ